MHSMMSQIENDNFLLKFFSTYRGIEFSAKISMRFDWDQLYSHICFYHSRIALQYALNKGPFLNVT